MKIFHFFHLYSIGLTVDVDHASTYNSHKVFKFGAKRYIVFIGSHLFTHYKDLYSAF